MFRTLRYRIIATYFVVVIVSLLLASIVFVLFLGRYQKDKERKDLVRQVSSIAGDIGRVFEQLGPAAIPKQKTPATGQIQRPGLVRSILNMDSRILKAKLVLMNSSGEAVAQSRPGLSISGRQLDLPESMLPQDGGQVAQEYLSRFGREYLFVSARTLVDPTTPGFLVAAKPVEEFGAGIGSLSWYVALAGLIALGISMLLALCLSGAISRPVRAVAMAARKMAAGDYAQKVEVSGSDEISMLAQDFNLMAERVRASHEQQQNFIGNVSHELRTPLTSIEGFSQALLDGVSQGEREEKRSLEIINQESKRLVRVVGDLLLLSQIDAGELTPDMKRVDLVDLVRKMESLFRARAEGEGITLNVAAGGGALFVNTDPDRLERILTNLLDNAMKYTGEGGTVTLSVSAGAGFANVSVADTGCGIDTVLLPKIFDRFYRVEESRSTRHGGAGLGLSICRELIVTLGGQVYVESPPGRGTTFTVALPL